MRAVFLLALVSIASGLNVEISEHEPNRPVSKVINLIKGMLKTLEKEAEEDQEVYDKMVCWCETYDKEKTEAIANAQAAIAALTKSIEENVGTIAELTAGIAALEKEVAANQDALKKATAIRQEELAEFNGEEKDKLGAISALKAAVTVLSKHHGSSLLQTESQLSTVVNAIRVIATSAKNMYIPLQHKQLLNAFLQEHGSKDYLDAAPTFKESFAPQSGQIFGILKSMQETFEANLSEAGKAELAAQEAYENLKAAKQAEIEAGQTQIQTKKDDLANTKQKMEESKTKLEDTKAQLSEDEKFLVMLKEKCASMDEQWDARTKARALEIEACTKGLAILSSDDNHDTFKRTFNFVQLSSTARDEAAAVLRATGSPKLAAIATKVKLDAFEKVKQAIDDLMRDLTTQQADEVKQKDFCVSKLNENEANRLSTDRHIKASEARIADLDTMIHQAKANIAEATKQIADTTTMMKRASEDREAENHDFQVTAADQKASIAVLNQALAVMEKVYASSLIQQDPPAGFKDYSKNEQGAGVVQMIKDIIGDAESLLAKSVQDEATAQKQYETLVKQGNLLIADAQKASANEAAALAGHEEEHVNENTNLDGLNTEQDNLNTENDGLHQSCDFLLKNFDTRQELRQQEIDALNKAKAILSGAKFD